MAQKLVEVAADLVIVYKELELKGQHLHKILETMVELKERVEFYIFLFFFLGGVIGEDVNGGF